MEKVEFEKIILDWSGSPVERGVDWLVAQSKRTEFIDLSHLWILTQTSGETLKRSIGSNRQGEREGLFAPENEYARFVN